MGASIKKHNEEAKRLAEMQEQDIKALMAIPSGRRFIFRLMGEICGVKNCDFTGNSSVYFNEGRRWVGIHIERKVMEADLDGYFLMLREAYIEEKNLKKEVEDNVGSEE